MQKTIVFVLCLTYVVLCLIYTNSYPQRPFRRPSFQNLPPGSLCVTRQGDDGICMEPRECEEQISFQNERPIVCQWQYHQPIVCCPSSAYYHHGSDDKPYASNGDRPPNLRIKGCGARRSITEFVVGGEEAQYWPWMAAIFVKQSEDQVARFLCGGTVISKRFILSAAHCLGERSTTIDARTLFVRVGGLKVMEGTAYDVELTVVHEQYKNTLHYNDIALLRLRKDIEEKNVIPVCLPSPGMYNANFGRRIAVITGWGDTAYGGKSSPLLREAEVPVVPNKRCNNRYKRLGVLSLPQGITDTQLCAGTEDGSKDACQGDSGGPLVLQDQSGKWNIIGIVSFGYGCGNPRYPGVYTRVAKYLFWLQMNTDIPARNQSW